MKKLFICFLLLLAIGCDKKQSLIGTIGSSFDIRFEKTNNNPNTFIFIGYASEKDKNNIPDLMERVKNKIDKEVNIIGEKKENYWKWVKPDCEIELSVHGFSGVKICYTEK